jgi:hypothetical protein
LPVTGRLTRGLVAAALLTLAGCSTGAGSKGGLRRLDGAGPIPAEARIGLTEFHRCGGAYLDRLNPAYYDEDVKAAFLLECTELGYPRTFQSRLRQRLEERLGKKLVLVRSERPFLPKAVLHDAEQQGLDYVLAGDLLGMGETASETLVSTYLFAVRVADRKVVLLGRVKKGGAPGRMESVIDEVADVLFARAFAD